MHAVHRYPLRWPPTSFSASGPDAVCDHLRSQKHRTGHISDILCERRDTRSFWTSATRASRLRERTAGRLAVIVWCRRRCAPRNGGRNSAAGCRAAPGRDGGGASPDGIPGTAVISRSSGRQYRSRPQPAAPPASADGSTELTSSRRSERACEGRALLLLQDRAKLLSQDRARLLID